MTKYQKKISGPLLDRIDIHVEVPRVEYEKLCGDRVRESSGAIRARVEASRQRQRERFVKIRSSHNVVCNADMQVGEVRQYCRLDERGQSLMRAATSCCA